MKHLEKASRTESPEVSYQKDRVHVRAKLLQAMVAILEAVHKRSYLSSNFIAMRDLILWGDQKRSCELVIHRLLVAYHINDYDAHEAQLEERHFCLSFFDHIQLYHADPNLKLCR